MSQNDSFTKVLLHFDGATGSTTITDDNIGGSAHTWTNNIGSITTGQSKFGGVSYDGTTGGWVDTPDSADFTLGSGDFTIDCWFNCQAAGGTTKRLAGQADSALTISASSFNLRRTSAGPDKMAIDVFVGAGGFTVTGTTQFTSTTNTGWHHLAVVRTGNTLKLFIDGVQEGGDTTITGSVNDSANKLAVGRTGESTANPWNGYIDEFRLSVGVARWTSNFTPPTGPYFIDEQAASGSFTLTGEAVTFQVLESLAAGSCTLTGETTGFQLVAPTLFGAFALAGRAAAFETSLTGTFGAFALAGQLVAFDFAEPVSVGTFTLTGEPVDLSYDLLGGGSSISGGTFSRQRWREMLAEEERRCAEEARHSRDEKLRRKGERRRREAAFAEARRRSREDAKADADAALAAIAAQHAAAAARGVEDLKQVAAHASLQARAAELARAAPHDDDDEEEAIALLLLAHAHR